MALWLGKTKDGRLELDPNTLVTHAVCVGMTGSGKTGLCIDLLEEIALAGVPIIAIDPKGDLTNLVLTEPPAEVSAEDAAAWKKGQAEWGITPKDVAAWSSRVDVRIYTPGSDAGQMVNVLGALRRPARIDDEELRREHVTGTISALLGLVGEEADPVRSPSHIVLSRILEDAWVAGQDPDIEGLLTALLDPPFKKVGVFPTDRFFPPDDRMDLARRLNAILVSPAFAAWAKGEPLDAGAMLSAGARTPIHIFTLAHLSEPERHFFVGLLLDQIALWTRALPGSTRLRALVFFDEVWGYLPPHPKNPPAKRPLLTLLKQARAVGVGVVLATQNPVDLDYKALSNAGTWLVGRLQTRNDRERIWEGLSGLDRAEGDRLLDELGKRTFLLHRSGKPPQTFQTRATRIYLAGPLTRAQLRALRPSAPPPVPPKQPAPPKAPPPPPRLPAGIKAQWVLDPRVVFSARMEGAFLPFQTEEPQLAPALALKLSIRFDEERAGFVDERTEWRVFFPLGDELPLAPLVLPLDDADLLPAPPADVVVTPLPDWLDEQREIERTGREIVSSILANETMGMWVQPGLKLYSRPGEALDAFQARCKDAIEERIRGKVEKLHAELRRKVDTLEARLQKLEQEHKRLTDAHSSKQTEELVKAGAALLGFFTNRRTPQIDTLFNQRQKVKDAQGKVATVDAEMAELRRELYELEAGLEADVLAIRRQEEAEAGVIQEKEIRLERDDVRILSGGVLWIPIGKRLPSGRG